MRNKNTPIAAEGYPFLAVAAVVTLVLACLSWQIPALLALAITLFVAYFFRNPTRRVPTDDRAVVAPADGVVVFLGNAQERHSGEEMLKISIFMSVFNVHINRVPFSGTVVDSFYRRGKFLDVRDEQATFENEQSGLVLETAAGWRMVVVQVAGLIARRIICYPEPGDQVRRGERYGLIRFGSRLDVYLPKGFECTVTMGQKTTAGETILGTMP
jgi:phosphatidylserine decarboxylase